MPIQQIGFACNGRSQMDLATRDSHASKKRASQEVDLRCTKPAANISGLSNRPTFHPDAIAITCTDPCLVIVLRLAELIKLHHRIWKCSTPKPIIPAAETTWPHEHWRRIDPVLLAKE